MHSSSEPEALTALGAARAGARRVVAAPLLLLGLWLVNLGLAAPAALLVAASIDSSIGNGLAHERLRDGFDMEWYSEYRAEARGLGRTFRPSLVGVGAFLDNLEGWLTGQTFARVPPALAFGVAYAGLWLLLLGGTVARLAGPSSARGLGVYFKNAMRYFPRLLRLALMSAALYGLVYLLARYLFERVDELLRDVTAETTALAYSALVWALTGLLLIVIHASFNYAKIAAVTEQRRSMLLAAVRGFGCALLHPWRTFSLYAGLLLAGALLLGAYALVAPGVGPSTTVALGTGLALGQIVLVSRLALRLTLLAGQAALYADLASTRSRA